MTAAPRRAPFRSTRTVCVLTAIAALLSAVPPAAAQVPPPVGGAASRPGPPQAKSLTTDKSDKPATAVIRGRVVSQDTGEAIRRARILLLGPRQMAVAADFEGRYEFKELPAGRYTVQAGRTGYVTLEYGQLRALQPGKPIELTDGQVMEKVDFTLPRAGVIAGRVFDDLGEPADQARVTVMRMQYFEGRRRLVPIGSPVQPDDLGQYRVTGLAPGTYYVGTVIFGTGTTPGIPAFAQTYYPGTTTPAEAEPVVLKIGQPRVDVDFGLVVSRPAKVSGAAFDSRGRPLAGAFVSTIQSVRGPTSSSTSSAPGATVQADGSFAIERVVPGEYTFSVQATNPVTGVPEAASVTITVTGEDISGLVLTTVGSVAVSGRIRFDPEAVPPFAAADLTVGIDQAGVTSSASPRVSSVTRNDWTFEMQNVPAGPRRFRVGGLPSGWAMKAILAGGRDVTDTPLNIRGDDDVTGLDIVVTNRLTTLSGSVTDSDLPVLDYSIVVYPEDSSMWIEKSRYLATARPDQAGAFSISGLPPGRYLVMATDYLEPGESNDPEFLEKMRPAATKVTLADGATGSVNLRLVKR